ncbi:toxin-activating lysine-acyltransferase [Azospirillum argentinense]
MNKFKEETADSEAGEMLITNKTTLNGAQSTNLSLENAASLTMAALLGEIVRLLTQSPTHRHQFLADLEWSVMPALMLRQIHLFRSKGRVVGVALWATVSDEVDARLSSGSTRLAPYEWKSGEILWLVDIVAPFGGAERMLNQLARTIFTKRTIKLLKKRPDGKIIVDTVTAT